MRKADIQLYQGSCTNMKELKDSSIDLIVTSPPYYNAIDYDRFNQKKNYKVRKDTDYSKFLIWLKECFKESYRVLKTGKFCCVVIATVLYRGKQHALPYHFVSLMEDIGFEFHQDIIWRKVVSGSKRIDVTVQNPYPGYYYPNFMFEPILVFRKPGPKIYRGRARKDKLDSKFSVDGVFLNEIGNNIWNIYPVAPFQYDHPCPFPEEIPYRLISLYSYKGDVVLDPFLGSGTTLAVALALGRKGVGYDLYKKYLDLTRKRLGDPVYLSNEYMCELKKMPKRVIRSRLSHNL